MAASEFESIDTLTGLPIDPLTGLPLENLAVKTDQEITPQAVQHTLQLLASRPDRRSSLQFKKTPTVQGMTESQTFTSRFTLPMAVKAISME
jgi:hypothetical protein